MPRDDVMTAAPTTRHDDTTDDTKTAPWPDRYQIKAVEGGEMLLVGPPGGGEATIAEEEVRSGVPSDVVSRTHGIDFRTLPLPFRRSSPSLRQYTQHSSLSSLMISLLLNNSRSGGEGRTATYAGGGGASNARNPSGGDDKDDDNRRQWRERLAMEKQQSEGVAKGNAARPHVERPNKID